MPENDPYCSISNYLDSLALNGGDARIEGVPPWLAVLGVALIVFGSHLIVCFRNPIQIFPGRPSYPHWNLFRIKTVKRLIRLPFFPLIAQSIPLFLLILVITAGLIGHEQRNIGPVLTWTWWWALLIFFILGFGKAFCVICPWEAVSSVVTSLSLKSRLKKLCYDFKWPEWARNVMPATFLFVLLTWFELGHNVTHSASMTAMMGLGMVSLAVMSAMIFEKRAFCRYGCLVGRISGLYSLFSPLELRPQSADVCKSCSSKACYHGTDTSTGCPTGLFPGYLKENTYCTLCTECVRSCPHENMSLRLRRPGTDLFNLNRFKWDEAMLAVILLSLTSFHGLTMTPLWTRLNQVLRAETGLQSTAIFSILMFLVMGLSLGLFCGCARLTKQCLQGSSTTTKEIFKAFAYSLIPVALFYHLAHNCMHFFLEAGSLIPLLSDPFGYGWNLFGTADKVYGPLLSLSTIWILQILCIVVGHIYGVITADRIANRIFPDRTMAIRSLIPLLMTMILYSCFSVWLVSQPMDMKTAM